VAAGLEVEFDDDVELLELLELVEVLLDELLVDDVESDELFESVDPDLSLDFALLEPLDFFSRESVR
jgi:hypothetical protein